MHNAMMSLLIAKYSCYWRSMFLLDQDTKPAADRIYLAYPGYYPSRPLPMLRSITRRRSIISLYKGRLGQDGRDMATARRKACLPRPRHHPASSLPYLATCSSHLPRSWSSPLGQPVPSLPLSPHPPSPLRPPWTTSCRSERAARSPGPRVLHRPASPRHHVPPSSYPTLPCHLVRRWISPSSPTVLT